MHPFRFVPLAALGLLLVLGTAAHAATATVTWDANTEPDLAGYKVYYSTTSGSYGTPVDVGNTTSHPISGLSAGTTYYFAVTAYDASGNESPYSAEVTVAVPAGNTPPQVTAPADVTTEATAALTPVSLGTATATDAEDGTLTATASPTGPFAVGSHTVTWTATDSAGATTTATQTVTVTDTTGPSVTAPADVTKEATGDLTTVSLGTGTATDLVDGSMSPAASPTGPFARGTHTVTWSATDAHGNTGTATQTVTITDTTPPAPPGGVSVSLQ